MKMLKVLLMTFHSERGLGDLFQGYKKGFAGLTLAQIQTGVDAAFREHKYKTLPNPASIRTWALKGGELDTDIQRLKSDVLPLGGWWFATDDLLQDYAWHDKMRGSRPKGLRWVNAADFAAHVPARHVALDNYKRALENAKPLAPVPQEQAKAVKSWTTPGRSGKSLTFGGGRG